MTEDQKSQNLEDNLPMVNYIMLHRIYDMLTLIAKKSVGADEVFKMVEYHNDGFLLGPIPSFTPQESEAENAEEMVDLEK